MLGDGDAVGPLESVDGPIGEPRAQPLHGGRRAGRDGLTVRVQLVPNCLFAHKFPLQMSRVGTPEPEGIGTTRYWRSPAGGEIRPRRREKPPEIRGPSLGG